MLDWFAAEDYWLGRLIVWRALAVIYCVAFAGALAQFRALLGSSGMLPIPDHLRAVSFRRAPSLFHWRYSDSLFTATAATGLVLALLTVAGVTERLPLALTMAVWLVMWGLYESIVNVGQRWYGFGWESLLLEVGFLAAFLGNASTVPPLPVLLGLRWVLFRLEFGAGMIKLRGDSCWRDLTCLYYHHETQPMPGPLSWWFHHLPRPLHRAEVAANHVTQLVLPFGLFLPQPVAGTCAGVMVLTQLWLVLSGNFSWLNWTAIVLALSAVPDSFWELVLPVRVSHDGSMPALWVASVLGLVVLVLVRSYWPVRNLISRRQAMNASFDPLHLVNTYGAFGSITRRRMEIVIEGTDDPGAGDRADWREYEFRGKPGDVRRLPHQFAPYHLRLDWLMWFAALSPSYAHPWFPRLMARLLDGDRDTLRLLRRNPFPDAPPAAIRARVYRYRFTTCAEHRRDGAWWHRELVGDFLGPVTRATLRAVR